MLQYNRGPSAHTHPISEIAGLQTSLNLKADVGGSTTPGISNVGTAVVIGDSISETATNDSTGYRRPAWFNIACIESGMQLIYVKNSAVGGNTTGHMLGRFDADVVAYKPRFCFIMGGTNDIATGTAGIVGGITPADTRANIDAMVAKCKTNGIIPILCTIPPRTDTVVTNVKQKTNSYNAWLKLFASKKGVMLLDFHSQLVDPATGGWKAGFHADGIHPDYIGLGVMGRYAAAQMKPLLPAWSPYLAMDNADPMNMVTNGLFITSTSGVPNNWTSFTDAPANTTFSVVADSGGAPAGNMASINKNAGSPYLLHSIATGFLAGDKLLFTGRVKSIGIGDASLQLTVGLTFVGGGSNNLWRPMAVFQNAFANGGTWHMELTVPAGTTSIEIKFDLGPGSGEYRFGQVTLVNLSANAIYVA
jgi:lysophospholipase L1-like esterase